MPNKDYLRSRDEYLSSNLSLAFHGLKEKVDGYVDSLSGDLRTNPSALSSAEKSVSAAKDIIQGIATGTLTLGMALAVKRVSLDFAYVSEPALQTAASSLGGYYEVVFNSIAEKERLDFQYKMMGINAAMVMVPIYADIIGSQLARSRTVQRFVLRTLGEEAAESFANVVLRESISSFVSRRVRNTLARRSAEAAARIGLGAALGPVASAIISLIELGVLAREIYLFFSEKLDQDRRVDLANSKALIEFFNPQHLVDLYQDNAFLLGAGDNMELQSLISTEEGDVSFISRTHDLAGRQLGTSSDPTVDYLRRFGYNTQELLGVAGQMTRSADVEYGEGLADLTQTIASYSGAYFGRDTSTVSSIMTDILRSSAYTERDINEARDRFEEFFVAVVGDGEPQAAHINLIKSLSEFAYIYGSGTRINLNASEEIAKIHQFMSDSGAVNERFDTSATKETIQSLDSLLLSGTTYQDRASASLVQSMGIGREDAIRGVTADANTFERTLRGILEYMRVDTNDIYRDQTNQELDPEFEYKFFTFVSQMRLDRGATNSLLVALQQYAKGKRIEDIRAEYMERTSDDFARRLGNALETSFEVVGEVTESADILLSTVEKNLDAITDIQNMMQPILFSNMDVFSDAYTSLISTLTGIDIAIGGLNIPTLGRPPGREGSPEYREVQTPMPGVSISQQIPTVAIPRAIRPDTEHLYDYILDRLGDEGQGNFTREFFEKSRDIANELEIPLDLLLGTMYHESAHTFSPSIINPDSGAIGLIQFTKVIWDEFNLTQEDFAEMSPLDQLDYVKDYFATPWRRRHLHENMSLSDLYMVIIAPAYAGSEYSDSHVVYREGTESYTDNENLDKIKGDGGITKGEIATAINRTYGYLFNDLQERSTGGMVFPDRGTQEPSERRAQPTNKSVHIKIPLESRNLSNDAKRFSDRMSLLLG